MSQEFDWDDAKARSNVRRHRVPFKEAASVFSDPSALTMRDRAHSRVEDRYLIVGMSDHGRVLAIIYTYRGRTIRIITAHRATQRERRTYEQR